MIIGVIGLGGAGRAHVERFQQNSLVEKVIGFDIKEVTLGFPVEIHYDFEKFIESVDAISICTPDSSHLEYIKIGISRNKHVLVEKPMVASLEQALELEKFLENKPKELVFAVHHQMRFVPSFVSAKRKIEEGYFGDIFYIEANYWHDMRARNKMFDDWRIKEGQSVIYGAACHPLDLLMYLMGDKPKENYCIKSKQAYKDYPLDYTSSTSLHKFANGATAKCHTNNCVVYPQMNNLIILGDKASFVDGVTFDGEFKIDIGQSVIPRSTRARRFWNVFLRKAIEFFGRKNALRFYPLSVYEHNIACQTIIDNFVDAIVSDVKPLVGFEDGKRVVSLCEEIEKNGAH